MKVLLVEPAYRNKYPPLGLMKISAYHKLKGHEVLFVKGKNVNLRKEKWDRIYVTTLFTFYWKQTVDTIKFYLKGLANPKDMYVGGVMASILHDDLISEPGLEKITIIPGLLDKPGVLGKDNDIVDCLKPDYSIINKEENIYLNYEYPIKDAYIAYSTRGCIRRCKFCAVPLLEPKYNGYISIKNQIKEIESIYGIKRNLMLLDNNILASKELEQIICDLEELGYEKNNKNHIAESNGKTRRQTKYIDFNQGTDARLINESIMQLISRLEIRPLRIAFDHADDININYYVNAVRLAAKYKFRTLSNYILFNFEDQPVDFYKRLKINIDLNEEFEKQGLKTSIWSFPMKYSPIMGINSRDRKYIGAHWNKKLLRGIQCVLNATHGVVGTKKAFFYHAFGKDIEEFFEILYMPEDLILNRQINESNGKIEAWRTMYRKLSQINKEKFIELIASNEFGIDKAPEYFKELYKFYI